ncbi:MAG TPA: chemotaxis response regulator protein-glutamate methylesterase, partial [Polyangiales bacterium]
MADSIVRVLVVDDSALVRKLLSAILTDDPGIEVVGTAADPYEAREKIKALSPDVVTLDVEMPKMDGLTFLRNLMRLRPMPVVMVSSLTEASADITIAALEAGAIDYVSKPKLGVAEGLSAMAEELCGKVKMAARVKVRPRETPHASVRKAAVQIQTTDRVIAIGASTGGTEAVADIMAELPPDCPAVLITQHIPEVFSTRFATRLDRISALSVSEAEDGAAVLLGHAYVAPGDYHLRLVRSGAKYYCRVTHDDTINRHRPAVDALFASVASEAGRNAIGVLLTGMGADGADGLVTMRNAGAVTIAQDRETSVVWGMPGEAVKRGGASETLPLG